MSFFTDIVERGELQIPRQRLLKTQLQTWRTVQKTGGISKTTGRSDRKLKKIKEYK